VAKSDSPFSGFKRFKPGVKRKEHILFTALLWSLVGLALFIKGVFYLWDEKHIYIFLLLGLLLGSAKALFILDKAAGTTLERIMDLRDGAFLGAIYSPKTWLLVLCMIFMGVILRNSSLPDYFLGTLYTTIGWALFLASRHGWLSWFRYQ